MSWLGFVLNTQTWDKSSHLAQRESNYYYYHYAYRKMSNHYFHKLYLILMVPIYTFGGAVCSYRVLRGAPKSLWLPWRYRTNGNDRELETPADTGRLLAELGCVLTLDWPWLNLIKQSQRVWDFLNRPSHVTTTDSSGLELCPEIPIKRLRSKSCRSSLVGKMWSCTSELK